MYTTLITLLHEYVQNLPPNYIQNLPLNGTQNCYSGEPRMISPMSWWSTN